MTMNPLASATSLSNRDLLDRLPQLAARERTATAELVAHLAALDMRPDLYAAEGYGSLFAYCTRALRLSEDAACTRIAAVSASRRFPQILDLLASGVLSLTAIRRIGPHLKRENCEAVLARAANSSRSEIDALVAELAPQPDVTPSVRKVPVRTSVVPPVEPAKPLLSAPTTQEPPALSALPATATPAAVAALPAPRRPTVQPSAPERYRVQFTIGPDAHEKLRRIQALLRREIPSGDPGLIFEQALELLLARVERQKMGKTSRPLKAAPIRSETDSSSEAGQPAHRYIPSEVRRVVWDRDGGRCAFVSAAGHRCVERSYLEFHHQVPYALGGQATVQNIALRCRRHNQHEARLVFGPRGESQCEEQRAAYTADRPAPRGGRCPLGGSSLTTRPGFQSPCVQRRFSESVVEDAALAWLEGLGYTVLHGPDIAAGEAGAERADPKCRDVLLERRLRHSLVRLNPALPAETLEYPYRKLTRLDAPSLIERNRAAHRLLVDGVPVEYRRQDGSIAGAQARVIDFDALDENDWAVVNQFAVSEGHHQGGAARTGTGRGPRRRAGGHSCVTRSPVPARSPAGRRGRTGGARWR